MRKILHIIAAASAAFLVFLAAPGVATAADGSPCAAPTQHPSFGAVQHCPIWMPARGHVPVHELRGGQPVQVGRLNAAGTANWFVCQTTTPDGQQPAPYAEGPYRNVWWARTLSDDNRWGWVNEVYFSGGGNDEADGGLRHCDGAAPPPPAPAPVDPAPDPAPKPSAPAPAAGGPFATRGSVNCNPARENRKISVGFDLKEEEYRSISQGSIDRAPKVRDRKERAEGLGSLEVRAVTCKTASGWKVLSPISIQIESRGLDREGKVKGEGLAEGWGIGVTAVTDRGIQITTLSCEKGWFWNALKEALGLPIPKVPFVAVSIPMYLGSKGIEMLGLDKLEDCRVAGDGLVQLRASGSGELVGEIETNFGSVMRASDVHPGIRHVRTLTARGVVRESRPARDRGPH